MSEAQEILEEALRVIHQEKRISVFEIQDALRNIIKDVDEMVKDCRIKVEDMGGYQPIKQNDGESLNPPKAE